MNLYEQLISQAPDIDCVLAITKIRPNARWGNNALIEDDFKDPDHADQIPTVQEILTAWIQVKAEQTAVTLFVSEAKQKEAAYSAWVDQGFDTGLGYKLRVADADQSKYANLVTGNLLEQTSDSVIHDIEAIDGTIKTLTWGQLKLILIAYKNYCYASWKAGKGIQ